MLTRTHERLRGTLHDTGMAVLIFGFLAVFGALSIPDAILSQAREGMRLGTDVPLNVIRLVVLGTLASSVAATAILVACVSGVLRLLVVPAARFAWAKAMMMKTARHGATQTRETADVA